MSISLLLDLISFVPLLLDWLQSWCSSGSSLELNQGRKRCQAKIFLFKAFMTESESLNSVLSWHNGKLSTLTKPLVFL